MLKLHKQNKLKIGMKFEELIDHCIRMIENFNPKNAVTSYVEEYLKPITNPYESVFTKQIFYGVIRYKTFLKVLFSRK